MPADRDTAINVNTHSEDSDLGAFNIVRNEFPPQNLVRFSSHHSTWMRVCVSPHPTCSSALMFDRFPAYCPRRRTFHVLSFQLCALCVDRAVRVATEGPALVVVAAGRQRSLRSHAAAAVFCKRSLHGKVTPLQFG